MAGIVKADVMQGLPGSSRHALHPRACPCISASNRPLCVELSFRSSWVNLCPFLYGVRAHSGGMIADLRTPEQYLAWLTNERSMERDWEVLCLRKESASTEAGAKLRD